MQKNAMYSNLSIIRHIAAETVTDNIERWIMQHYPAVAPVGLMEVLVTCSHIIIFN